MPTNVVDLPAPDVSVVAATTKALTSADRLDSPAGAAALVLAARLDAGADTGSGMASMTKELRALLAEVAASGERQSDGVDEIRAQAEKRRQRLAGVGGR